MVYEENKQPRNEEEVNKGKVGILKIMLGTGKKSPGYNS